MEKDKQLQHTQVPNGMGKCDLEPRDQLIYMVLHSHNNAENKCFPFTC